MQTNSSLLCLKSSIELLHRYERASINKDDDISIFSATSMPNYLHITYFNLLLKIIHIKILCAVGESYL